MQEAKQWREKSLAEGRKKVGTAQQQQHRGQKRKDRGSEAAAAAEGGAEGGASGSGTQQQQQQQGKQGKRRRGEDGEGEGGLSFSKLDFGGEPRQGKKQRRRQSKEQLLAAAEEKQANAQELGASQSGKVRGPSGCRSLSLSCLQPAICHLPHVLPAWRRCLPPAAAPPPPPPSPGFECTV